MSAKRYTWRKGKTRDGMWRIAPHYTLHRGTDEVLARVQQHRNGNWYWYGAGQNTAHDPVPLAECKSRALSFIVAEHEAMVATIEAAQRMLVK